MSEPAYQIIEVHTARPAFLAAAAEARRHRQTTLFLRAARWVLEELARTPTEFGESGPRWERLGIAGRRGFAGPLYVDFGVDDTNRFVYLRRFAWFPDRAKGAPG